MKSTQQFYAGLDVSLEKTAICIVNYDGDIIKEKMVNTDPDSIDNFFKSTGITLDKIGVESSNLTIWLYWTLKERQYNIISIEVRRAAAFMSAQKVKTDRNDARGIAHMMRGSFYTKVHIKSDQSQRLKLLLNNRKFLVTQRVDIENQIRGSLKTFGLKIGETREYRYDERVRKLV